MLATVNSCALTGIEGFLVRVEVNLSAGMPMFDVVGLPDAAVKESRERVRAALKNSGYGFPDDRLTVNLAPADQKKEGPFFDLPIALGVIAAEGRLPLTALEEVALVGELSLDGSLRSVRGALPMAIALRALGVKALILPEDNRREVACVSGIALLPARHLREVVTHLGGQRALEPVVPVSYRQLLGERVSSADFADVKGQMGAKRALEIAASGGHNVLMVGAPGSGKTLLSRALPTILPDMSFEEALEVTRIHSTAGLLPKTGLLTERPFRSPHHTASSASMAGGGANALPGEISKAHQGVLFLDELPEYRRDVLEALRQPMEDGFVTVTRVNAQMRYPSEFMLVCSMNPCPCGHYGSRTRECRCTPGQIQRYLGKVSGPLLDRIDMHIEVESVAVERLAEGAAEESSASVRARVEAARAVQRARYAGQNIACNARLPAQALNRYCPMDAGAKVLIKAASDRLDLSSRAYTRVLKLARTIADMEGRDVIGAEQVAEAVQYRSLDKKYWG
ncbi:YifB family Mg chelatase-like AAA ATPase [Bacillota bacterium Meth-B3]